MGVRLELRTMVDQALGCPAERGIVNFNVLHSLLHQILNHLDSENVEEGLKSGSVVLGNEEAKGEDVSVEQATGKKGLISERASDAVELEGKNDADGDGKSPLSSSAVRSDGIEERLHSLESRFEALNNLPIDKSIIVDPQQTDATKPGGNPQNALAIMWKIMTIHRRVQATEEAVEKVMGIVHNVLRDISQLKDLGSELEKLREEHLKTQREFNIVKNGALQTKREKVPEVAIQPGMLASKNDLAQFVTWSALEEALNNKECGIVMDAEVADGAKLEESSLDQHETAPVSSSTVWENVDNVPPKTSTPPGQFTEISDESPNICKSDQTSKETAPDTANEDVLDSSLSLNDNSFGEISDKNVDELSRDDSKDSLLPSPHLITQLNRLGELPKQHDDVVMQVSTISEIQSKLASEVDKIEIDILPQKIDKGDLEVPDNLMDQIDMLKQGLAFLNANQDLQMLATIKETTIANKENIDNVKRELGVFSQHMKRIEQPRRVETPESAAPGYDQGVLNSVRDQLTVIEEEQEKMAMKSNEDVERILENLDKKQRLIDDLVEYTKGLQETKAERENVATEMDVKADKHALDGKVNQSMFDETIEMFDRGLHEALQKMENYMNEEIGLKDTLSRISDEMEGKIDSDSLQLMKDYFEKQIKDVQESRDKIARETARETRVDATEAAGVRRKLPIHYHCISCNRPVEVTIKDSEPALPGIESLPLRRLKFPLTSYEVEQVRQSTMNANYNVDDSPSVRDLIANRPCGGSHTVINSNLRRSTKLHQYGQTLAARDDLRQFPRMTREASVLAFLRGSDGHYYKGRSRQILPSLLNRTVPSFSDTVEENSVKGKQLSPIQTPVSISADQKSGSPTSQRVPSPPRKCVDDLSSSYPQRSLNHTKMSKMSLVHHYSCDDLNMPSTTSLNSGESIKVLRNRRKNLQDKETRRQCCWGNQLSNEKQDKSHDSDDESTKSIKRTTPVGQEGSCTVSRESTYQEHVEQQGTSSAINYIKDNKDKN